MRSEDLLNRIIADYQLLEILGKGGMSTVFLAQSRENPQERVAIKILLPSDVATIDEFATFQARFQREAQAAHQLHHEHILPVLNYGEDDGLFYMIMPVIANGTLSRQLAAKTGPFPLEKIATYLDQLADAVDYAHQHGLIHRDLKPSNVLIDEQETVYLADFGIVHLFDKEFLELDEALTTLTTTGKIYGTPAYMAPERFKGEPAEPATDVYALGVLLYQLVTGRVPFEADNPLALGMKHLTEEPIQPRSLRPDLPEPAEAAILKAIAKQPSERFSTASALAAAFRAGLAGEWPTELLPFAVTSAARQVEAPVNMLAVSSPAPIGEEIEPDRLVLGPMSEVISPDIALAPTPPAMNVSGVVFPQSERRRNVQFLAFSALVIVILLCMGLLAFAAYKLATTGAPSPNILLPTSTPAKAHTTPASSAGATQTSGRASTPGATPSPTSTPGTTPTAMPSPTPTLIPTPSATPVPVPTSTP